jgi:hypothetical protein
MCKLNAKSRAKIANVNTPLKNHLSWIIVYIAAASKTKKKCFKFLHQDPGLAGRESKTILQTHGSGDFKFVPRT